MSKNFKKMLSYYKPYRCIFWADMFFATVSAAVALAIPLVIRYVTYTLVYEDKAQIMFQIKIIAAALFAMVAADCYSKFFISNYGHVMGAKIGGVHRPAVYVCVRVLPEWQNAACVPPEPCEDCGDQRAD